MRLKSAAKTDGFTLMEILIAITTFMIIAAAIYSSLNAGLRMWRGSNRMIGCLQTARVFFALMSTDLRNAVVRDPEGMNFEGSETGMAFMTVITAGGREFTHGPELAKVAYYLDSRARIVKRVVAGKTKDFDISKASPVPVFTGVDDEDFGFEYYYKSGTGNSGHEWKDEWSDSRKIPLGVRININGLTRYVFIPTGETDEETQA